VAGVGLACGIGYWLGLWLGPDLIGPASALVGFVVGGFVASRQMLWKLQALRARAAGES
jgi:hypothetical protein